MVSNRWRVLVGRNLPRTRMLVMASRIGLVMMAVVRDFIFLVCHLLAVHDG